MKLFILLHGDAELSMGPDAERQLTHRGIEQTRQLLQRHLPALQAVTRIVASPYRRAQQTAQLAAELLDLAVETDTSITPDGGTRHMAALCESLANDTPLLVSHQPLVGNFVDWLGGLERGRYFMGTSALAAFDADIIAQGCGELLWLHQPGDAQ